MQESELRNYKEQEDYNGTSRVQEVLPPLPQAHKS
jgi:hypothetical protein